MGISRIFGFDVGVDFSKRKFSAGASRNRYTNDFIYYKMPRLAVHIVHVYMLGVIYSAWCTRSFEGMPSNEAMFDIA